MAASDSLSEQQFARVDHNDDGRVYVGSKSIGRVRPNTALEGTGMVGRKWVGEDRSKKRRTGLHDTAHAAAHDLATTTGWLK